MTIEKFKKTMDDNFAIRLNEKYMLFKDYELYDLTEDKSIQLRNLEGLLNYKDGMFKKLIEETENFYVTFNNEIGRNLK